MLRKPASTTMIACPRFDTPTTSSSRSWDIGASSSGRYRCVGSTLVHLYTSLTMDVQLIESTAIVLSILAPLESVTVTLPFPLASGAPYMS